MHRRSDTLKRCSKQAAFQSGFHLPSQRESDFYWPTNVASRSRTEVNQYKWLGLSSLPFKIHELLGNKATAERDPCWKRFWSLFSTNRHPWMLSDGWQCPGCIIFKEYNGLVSPHKEGKCQCGDIVPLFNTVEIKSLCWIYPLIYAYPSEKTERTWAQGEEGDDLSRLGFCLFADGPCQSHRMLEIRFKKRWNVWKGKNKPRKCKGQRRSPETKRHQSREATMVFALVSSSRSAAKCHRQSKRVHLASALSLRTLQQHRSRLRHTRTSLHFYLGEDFHSCNVLPSPLP